MATPTDKQSFSAKPGDRIRISNTSHDSITVKIEYEDGGTVSSTMIIGSHMEVSVGTLGIDVHILPDDFDVMKRENIVRINQPE